MWHLIRAVLLLFPRLIWSMITWIFRNSNHPEKTPINKRYNTVRKLILKVNKALRLDVEVFGKENIPDEVSCFYCNHLAAVDPLLFIETMDKPVTFVAKEEIKKMPLVGRIFSSIDGLFLNRTDLKQQLKVMMKVQDSLKNQSINWVIYPEGTRNKDPMNKLLPFHHGTFRAAMKANVPLVPVVSYGTFRLLDLKHSYKRYPTFIKYLKPIYPSEYEGKTTEEVAKIIQSGIQKEVSFFAKPLDHKNMTALGDKYYRFNRVK